MSDVEVNVRVGSIALEDMALGVGEFDRVESGGVTQSRSRVSVLHGVHTLRDGETIAEAIANAPASGLKLIIPPGTHDVSDVLGLLLQKPLTLMGLDAHTTILDGGVSTPAWNGTPLLDVRHNLRLKGLTFQNMGPVAEYNDNTGFLGHLEIDRCRFISCGAPVYWDNPITGSGIVSVRIRRNEIDSCERGIVVGASVITEAEVLSNTIRTVKRVGIQLGYDGSSATQPTGTLRVALNNVSGVTDTVGVSGAYRAWGVACFGNNATIVDNTIRNVTTTPKTNAVGILTKARHSNVRGNILTDAGQNDGGIAIQGNNRAGTGTGPNGYAVQCVGNEIHVINNSGVNGIQIQADDVLVEGNTIENVDIRAIYSSINRILDHITVRGNTIINCRGNKAIDFQHSGAELVIEENRIDGIDGSLTTALTSAAILVRTHASASGLAGVRIRRNRIRGLTAAGGRAIWTMKGASDVVTDVEIDENDIDGASNAGIYLEGASPIAAVKIRRNRIVNVTAADQDIYIAGGASYAAAGAIIEGNYGDFVNENEGIATLANGTTSIAVNHGLSDINGIGQVPLAQDFDIHPIETLGTASYWWVDTITATQFTIKTNADPGADVDFAWRVRRRIWQT